jgi:hypothetical protein
MFNPIQKCYNFEHERGRGRLRIQIGKEQAVARAGANLFRKGIMRSPDVIATSFQNTALFEPQTHTAASWLSARCDATLENIHDQVCVDSRQEDQIIRELKAAGFQVIKQTI